MATKAAKEREEVAEQAKLSAEGMRKANEERLREAERTKAALNRLAWPATHPGWGVP